MSRSLFLTVIPAKAGIQSHAGYRLLPWIPAFAGMTEWEQGNAR